jgi:hypothetical protein
MSLLLTVLFSFLTQHLKVEKKMEKARAMILERQHLQTRLQDILTSLNHSAPQPPLYTQMFPKEERESLIVVFDNGIDPDPLFSGTLIGRIYLDEKKNLSLAVWPLELEKERHWRKEVLALQVVDFSFQFLGEKKEADPKVKSITAHAGWHPSWPEDRKNTPSLIRLTLRQGGAPLEFAFRLPTATPIATYWEGGYKL